MTAATLTPAAAGADLLADLRQLLARHDGAATLEDLREVADELTAALRRVRGRITRLTRQATPRPATPAAKAPTEPAAQERQAEPAPAPSAATPAPKPDTATVAPPARPAAVPQPTRTPDPAPALAVPPRPARRVSTLRYAMAALTMLCTTVGGRARRAIHTATARIRRGLTLARTTRRGRTDDKQGGREDVCIVCGPGCCSPILGVHTSCPGPSAGSEAVMVR